MRILQTCVVVLFLAVTVIFGYCWITEQQKDTTLPVITVEGDTLDVSLTADNAELLQGVTAFDEKDGDITDRIIVESISRFTEPGVAIVTYAVCDSDRHVASASRTIRYIGYEAPRFTMRKSLIFSPSERVLISGRLGAWDVLDGDISSRVIVTATDYADNTSGLFHISVRATSLKGDTITATLPLYVENVSPAAPDIRLREYMIYLNTGDEYDPASNLIDAIAYNEDDLTASVEIESDLDTSTPGVYQVHYYATDDQDRRAHEILTILVEG
ncbi:MAG: DUF5011 domain-containing protein [Clostridia bacterium]|nr:DUF5011 domain-containing protein [Clostridia bacterium]MBQ8370322.1 DUF5011 domain-containing protein [Clostridia bacterium]